MDIITRPYYLTDRAYTNLVTDAKKNGFIKWNSDRARGLSEYLNQLALQVIEDTRPSNVQQRHREEIRNNRAPLWLSNNQRRSRLLRLSDDAIVRYVVVAERVGIIRNEPFVIGGPDRRTPYPTVAFVLEAIGLRWLTPQEYPYASAG